MKKYIILFFIFLVAGWGIYIFISNNKNDSTSVGLVGRETDTTYVIDGREITLENGLSEIEIVPGSASTLVTRYFGNSKTYDFNKDGKDDIVFLVTQNSGGSGSFFYVVTAITTENGHSGSRGFFLGDRIAPQTTEISADGMVTVNYADRVPGESFAVSPSMGKSLRLLFNTQTMEFKEMN
ncbi:hypothetical protein C4565_04045 [Candidatus Parcubacteria bacterium]|jgi:hypothetical protein|nr:MAG: hypothetical protein C4565_04045 [Candidatus Parcubacteria bacterium]